MDRNRLLIIIIVGLLVVVFALNSNALNLQGYFKKPNESGTITAQDEERPVMRRQDTASDGGAFPAIQERRPVLQRSQPIYTDSSVEIAAPGAGQWTKGGPGSAQMDKWYQQHPEALQGADGNAPQIGSGRPAEVPGLPSLAEIERQRRGRQ